MLCAALFTIHYSLFTGLRASAQGLPLIRNYTAAEYGGHNINYDIEIGEDGTVYVANFEGLLYYDRARWRIIHSPNNRRITAVYRDSKNTICVDGYNYFARLQKHPNGELAMVQISKDGQLSGEVTDIFEEEITQTEKVDGGLQVKVKKNGGLIIADSDGRDLYTITEANGLCSNQVACVAYDGHGVLWGATANGIFSIELPSAYSYFLPKDGLTGRVHAIKAFNGKVYIGDTNGLFVVDSWQYKRVGDINNVCWELCPSRDGLLAATSSGIYQIAANGSVSRLTSYATTALLVDGDKVYAGETDGVWLYQSGQRTRVNDIPLVTTIHQDAQGHLSFQTVHREISGSEEMTEKTNSATVLTSSDSTLLVPLSGIKTNVVYRHDDHLWMGGDEILAIIDTRQKDMARLADSRHVRFCSIIMGNDSVMWGGYGQMPQQLPHLASHERHLHFYYAIDYAPLTGKTLYRYRLNHDNWSAWSEKQDVEFLNLPYGSFTLSIQAQLANGERSEIATVGFSIAYPVLMRWYMLVIYLLIFAGLVYLLFRYRLRRLEKDKIKLERIVEERTADLRNAQQELIRQEKMASVGKLTQGLIDRILNPMNYIINFSTMSNDLLKDLKGDIDNNKDVMKQDDYEDMEDLLDMLAGNLDAVRQYGQNTSHTLQAMQEMLKDRTTGYVDMDLLPVLQQNQEMLDNYFAKEKAQYHIATTFTLPADAMMIHGNPKMLSKVIMSLLDNAVYAVVKKAQKNHGDRRPAPSQGQEPMIHLSATVANDDYVLKIRDNGIGIEEKIIHKIFDPFFTTKTTDEAAGIGLYLSREIIQIHGGDISVATQKDEFTEFTITLPNVKKGV